MQKKKFKVLVTEKYTKEIEFIGTQEELEHEMFNYELIPTNSTGYDWSMNCDFDYKILEEKEV